MKAFHPFERSAWLILRSSALRVFALGYMTVATVSCGRANADEFPLQDAATPLDAFPAPDAFSTPDGATNTCTTPTVPLCPDPAPRFPDVAPIFEVRCASSGCHSGVTGGPWPLRQY